jgi:choline dehydrogenase-like flavoprotein
LGGTSLINANVFIVPDPDVFAEYNWPSAIHYDDLQPYYQRARQVLASTPHPRAMQLAKIKALSRRADELGIKVDVLDINVNFTIDGANPYGANGIPSGPEKGGT